MNNDIHLLILLIGAAIVGSLFLRILLQRLRIPPLIGYIALGIGLGALESHYEVYGADGERIFEFLAQLGVIALLLRIGLESDFRKLAGQLRRAGGIWAANITVSAVGGFFVARSLLGIAFFPSLIVATAFTATSVGVSLGMWRDAGALQSDSGELLLDVAEMDDLSAILLMALLFDLLPDLRQGQWASLPADIVRTGVSFVLKLVGLATLCFLFARYAEEPITRFVGKRTLSLLLMVAGGGFVIAGLAGMLGFSTAIGAFLAGLVFRRDPESIRIDASFGALYDFFTPFFFIGIGLRIDPTTLIGGLGIGLVLAAAAIVVKVLGAGLPALLELGVAGGVLIGASMVPRAEIAMVIMQNGMQLGSWAVPGEVFSGMVVVSAVTCLVTPLIVHPLLARGWQNREASA